MASIRRTSLTVSAIAYLLLFTVSSAQNSCKRYKFSDSRVYNSCTDLPVLDAHLHWNYDPLQTTVKIAYRATQKPEGWVAWGINPTGTGMLGTQALIAHQDTQGKMRVFSTQVTSYSTSLTPGSLSFPVSYLSAEYSNSEMIIRAVLGPLGNGSSTFNVVWQAGDSVVNDVPRSHPVSGPNVRSFGALNFLLA